MFLELDHVMATDPHFRQIVLIHWSQPFQKKFLGKRDNAYRLKYIKYLVNTISMGLTLQPTG